MGRIDPAPGLPQLWVGLSAFFVFVSADEFGEIHERLERITGIDWQILYSPIGLLAAVLWVFVARRLRQIGAGFALLVVGTLDYLKTRRVDAVHGRLAALGAIVVGCVLLSRSPDALLAQSAGG